MKDKALVRYSKLIDKVALNIYLPTINKPQPCLKSCLKVLTIILKSLSYDIQVLVLISRGFFVLTFAF